MIINYSNIVSSYKKTFFSFTENDKFSRKVKENKIPNSFGVYILYKNQKSYENIIYIGKAGEFKNDGTSKNQGLSGRLINSRSITSNKYFKSLFSKEINEIILECFETPDEILPSFVEVSLIQEYFFKFKRLPMLNKSF